MAHVLAQLELLILEQVQQCREQYRRSRAELAVPLIALVGYTNAGKSCLMNALTSAGVFSEDALFATLDTTVRKIALPSGLQVTFWPCILTCCTSWPSGFCVAL